jgi:opacity protein-like surface antigen
MNLKKLGIFLMVPAFALSVVLKHSAHAEPYFGGSIGVGQSSETTGFDATKGTLKGTLTDLDSGSSFAYGVKAGHYFESIPWLGVEFNFYQRDPDVGPQNATVTGTAGLFGTTTASVELDVDNLTTYGFLLMFRATEEQYKHFDKIQPYLGLGIAINNLNLGTAIAFDINGVAVAGGRDSADLGSDTRAGFLFSAGLNYKIYDHLKAYGEYKFTQIHFSAETAGTKYDFDLDDSSLMFGAIYNY